MFNEQSFESAIASAIIEYLDSKMFKDILQGYIAPVTLSDIRKKRLAGYANKADDWTTDDITDIMRSYGNAGGADKFNFDDMQNWTDDMLNEYADNLINYVYTYKEEAQNVDPSIDPEEVHRGPMAQDIEKVAPDCVRETPDGIKVVDGNRLALVNAGVIGDLARRLIALENKVEDSINA